MIIAFYPGAGGNRYLQRLLGRDWVQPNISYDHVCDHVNLEQHKEYRYLLGQVISPGAQYALTHCMNSQRIREKFPGKPIVFIKSDLKTSLQREWGLKGHEQFITQSVKNVVSKLEHYIAFKDPTWPEVTSEQQIDQLPKNILQEVNNDYNKIINNVFNVPSALTQVTQRIIDKISSAYEMIMWHQEYYRKYPLEFSSADQVIDISTGDDDFSLLMQTELSRHHSEIFNQVWEAVNEQ